MRAIGNTNFHSPCVQIVVLRTNMTKKKVRVEAHNHVIGNKTSMLISSTHLVGYGISVLFGIGFTIWPTSCYPRLIKHRVSVASHNFIRNPRILGT